MFPMIDRQATGENLRMLMNQRGITVKDVQQYLGLASVQSVYHWLSGISMPTIDNLYALSELFLIPIDEMVCGNRSVSDFKIKDADSKRIYMYYQKINEKRIA